MSLFARLGKISRTRKILIAVLMIALIAGGAAYLWHRHNDNLAAETAAKHVKPKPVTDKVKASAAPSSINNKSGSGSSGTQAVDNSNITLVKPSGTFVSNHKPGQNGSPMGEASVCNTSPGASCDIVFTKDGVTKSLGAKTADDSGAVYWSWAPQSAGLTPGNWTVTATATLGQQTQSTQDPTPLEVSP